MVLASNKIWPASRIATNTFIKDSTKPIARPFHMSASGLDPLEDPIKLTTKFDNMLEEPEPKGFKVFDKRDSCGPITSRAPVIKLISNKSSSRPMERTMENTEAYKLLSPLPST